MDILEKINFISGLVNDRNPDLIDQIYDFDTSDPDYDVLIETLVEKAGDLVFQEEYEYAYKIIEGVLYNNLTHVQAQELYLILDQILKEKAEEERVRLEAEAEEERIRLEAEAEEERIRRETAAEEERLRLEAEAKAEQERLEAEAEAERRRIAEEERIKREEEAEARRQEEKAIRDAEVAAREAEYQAQIEAREAEIAKAAVYEESIRSLGLKNFNFYSYLYPGNFIYYTSEVNTLYHSGENLENILYGMALQAGGNFIHPFIIVNLDAEFDFGFVGITDAKGTNYNLNTALSVSTPTIFLPISLRLGFYNNQYNYDVLTTTDMAVTKFPSVFVGAGFKDFRLFDRMKADLSFDYYLTTFLAEHIDTAFGANLAFSYRIMEFKNFNLHTRISSQLLTIVQAGMYETNINGKLGIGISFNE
ncbi:MAG: hypothetical protein JEY99_07445 [Spirochaetales bacterium]|nr:hypothetical protein [Spirochaetales bacterium]